MNNNEMNKVEQIHADNGSCEKMPMATMQVLIPEVDLIEQPDALSIYADMPGVDPGSIEIEYEQQVLKVSAFSERFVPEQAKILVQEHRPGRYNRAFRVGQQIDPQKIEAHYENGVLLLKLYKQESVQPRRIPVNLK